MKQAGKADWRMACAIIGTLTIVAACSSAPVRTASDSVRSVYASLLGASEDPAASAARRDAVAQDLDAGPVCPEAFILPGAAYHALYERNQPASLRHVTYQAVLTRTARECAYPLGAIDLKFGFAGRVLVGPRGTPGKVVVPVQAALLWRGRTVAWSKDYKLQVDIAEGARSAQFTHVEENLLYQLPAGHSLADYRIEIGFENGDAGPVFSSSLQ